MIDEILASCKEEISKSINHQINEYMVVRAGRANPHILDKVFIDYYGVPTPLKNMASITVPEARMLCVSEMIEDLEKNGEISEDEQTSAEKEVQKIIDNACDKIDENFKAKEKEIMEV